MPLSDLVNKLNRLAQRLDNEQVVDGLVDKMRVRLQAANYIHASGRTKANISTKSPITRLGRGRLFGGLGNKNAVGDWDARAPRGTLRAFFEAHKNDAKPIKPNKWRFLSGYAKELLEKERLQGKYGGETAAGVGKSPYALMLDGTSPAQNASASRAGITPTRYIGAQFKQFSKVDVPQYVNQVVQEALSG